MCTLDDREMWNLGMFLGVGVGGLGFCCCGFLVLGFLFGDGC